MVLSENHQLMRKLFRQFAETEFTPALLDRLDETGEFDWDTHHKRSARLHGREDSRKVRRPGR